MKVTKIFDLNSDLIVPYKSMKDNLVDRYNNALFISEGEKVVIKLLKSNLKIISILAKESFFQEYKTIIEYRSDITLITADKEVLTEIIGFRMHTGVMALAYKPENLSINDLNDKIVLMNSIIDSENVGSIVRNCVAFGIQSIICDNGCSSPYLRRAVRVSMGTIFNISYYKSTNVVFDLLLLKSYGYKIIASEIHDQSQNISQFVFPDKFVIIFGNESQGVNRELLQISDYIVHIPISKNIESLNVAVSSGIILSRIF